MSISTVAMAALVVALAPPSGRPPEGALERYEPRIYDVKFEVQLAPAPQRDISRHVSFDLRDTPVVMPVIFQSTFSIVDPESLGATLWLNGIPDPDLTSRTHLDEGFPFHTQLAVLPIARFVGDSIRWELHYKTQVYSSRLDDLAAAEIRWPREWPGDVKDGLEPQMFIESDDPIFARTIEDISEGNLRGVPPFLAAKDIIRYSILNVRITSDGEDRKNFGMLHGLEMVGARRAAEQGAGSPADLVCVCVAMLRAAGIPARPVIGIEERMEGRRGPDGGPRAKKNETFVIWAEFYLPDTGWIPFDPVEMGGSVRNRNVRHAWPHFGSLDDLNKRATLAFHFIPPASVEVPENPAVWGWDPRPTRPTWGTEQTIELSMIYRGKGVEIDE